MKKQGEIWFAKLPNAKNRPVVVIGNELIVFDLDRIVASVTSQKARNQFDVNIEKWQEAGLDKPSVVRTSKISHVHKEQLLFKIGRLDESDLQKVLDTARKIF